MKSDRKDEMTNAILRVIPAKWLLCGLALLILYAFFQPRFNDWFGWRLPSLAGPQIESPAPERQKKETSDQESSLPPESIQVDATRTREPTPTTATELPQANRPPLDNGSAVASKQGPPPADEPIAGEKLQKQDESQSKEQTTNDSFLKSIGRERYQSPAGLIYGPGSEEGHRLKHIERHLKDIPDRPGSHGVFSGTREEFLQAIDDTFKRASDGAKNAKRYEDEGAMVFEATFDKPLGFLGGQSGKRQKNPKLRKLRVVVRGTNVITAFPF